MHSDADDVGCVAEVHAVDYDGRGSTGAQRHSIDAHDRAVDARNVGVALQREGDNSGRCVRHCGDRSCPQRDTASDQYGDVHVVAHAYCKRSTTETSG